ncbi:hypothetical protein [Curtobacterium sp. VKM Ac-2884]|uniref:hypothetical protein n=1 Tax=Curtobacterium sp. VKM Ac-2884 TaxID=2783818 RepID=UPI00188B3E71|nr:hypothetical protein [Curtobacterium sp. VKM Ac-2884]MBF4605117.1 hypothetical protein [Curtobacterium sp. VKM Ac-2884]
MKHTTRNRGTALIAAALIACTTPFALAACSTGPDSAADTTKSAAAGIGAKWGDCMRDAGYDVQDPDDAMVSSGAMQIPPSADQEEFLAAGTDCAEKAGVKRTSNAEKQKWERQYAQVASCIRDDGYPDFPEQKPGTFSPDGYAHSEDDEFKKTVQECMDEFAPDVQTQHVG